MLDLKFLRENPDIVKKNIENKFQQQKLPLVDEVIELDAKARATQQEADDLRANRNKISKQIGALMGQGKKDEAMELKAQVEKDAARLSELEEKEKELQGKITKIMMTIPNIIDPSVPIGKDDSCNVEIEKFGEPVVPDFEIPYHTEIMERFDGIDLDAAGKVAGNGFYYLMGDIARLHSAVISYARDFMIDRGFTYCVPPFMIRSNVVTGVMSFDEMDAMMYKIEGEDLYLIGTSEHSMIGKFIDTINEKEKLPYTLTSYSPCFRKEKGAHGIEERGVYRIHQFEKQEMIVVCEPEESKLWYDKLWQNTVDLFRSLDIPVRTLECCSGDLADLKVKSCDVEAWSPRQKKYFEVGSCSNLGDAQARRLKIRIKNGKEKYFAKRDEIIKTYKAAGRGKEIQHTLKELKKSYKTKVLSVPEDLCWLYGRFLEDYLHDVEICQAFARRNRERMAEIILEKTGMSTEESFHTIHNYIDTEEMILRKGAIAARKGEKVLIPVNMRDGSILAIGKGNKEWNDSAPHGAGRLMSRTRAKEQLDMETYKEVMKEVYTTSVNEQTLDEAPMAYKSLEDIIDVVSESVDVVEVMKPVFNFKAS